MPAYPSEVHVSRFTHFVLSLGAATLITAAGLVGEVRAHAAQGTARTAAATRSSSLPGFQLGAMRSLAEHGFMAYYDGHKDSYVNNDVSVKGQARSLGINFSPILAHALSASSPMYFVKGRSAAGQIAVFGSEPGESDYSPLWREIRVTWKSGVKPVLLVRDDQITSLAKAGKLTTQMTNIVLNAPVISVGH
jgi:hypothetical protein